MDATSASVLRFGPFELDLITGELRKAGVLINLPPQPFKILALLASRSRQLVTREEIQKEIWGDDTFVDFEKGLNFAIRRIRVSLGDDAEVPRYIETLPRRGYRFIAAVETEGQASSTILLSPATPVSIPEAPPPIRPKPWRLAFWGLIFLVVGGSLLTGFLLIQPSRRHPIRSIAVLPLENLSEDPAQEYFADGLTDGLITELARISELRVTSRTSSKQYKKTDKPLRQIARELAVDAVVEGTVFRSDDQIRITAQLIQTEPEGHLWAEVYETKLGDVLSLQTKLAREIAGKIRIKLTPEEQKQLSRTRKVDGEALDAYLKGRQQWEKREADALRRSIQYFKTAYEKDPRYCQALAGLADSYVVLNDYDLSAPVDSYSKAKAAALKALVCDETLGEAHATLASVKAEYEWDWPGAEQEFRRALELAPQYATAHQWYSEYLLRSGRFAEAFKEINRAYELDPLSPIINAEMGGDLYWARRYDDAILQLSNSALAEPGLGYVHSWLGFAFAGKGRWEQARIEFENAVRISGGSPSFKANLAYVLGRLDKKREALAIAKELEVRAKQSYVSPYARALVYIGLGRRDLAFQRLEEAFKEHDPGLNLIKIDPTLDRLRSDPRFESLQQRIGL